LADGGCLAAAVAVEDGVCCQEVDELVEITAPGGGEKGPKQGLAVFG
jgi:hypothetical protein